jgi:hypothetical protein
VVGARARRAARSQVEGLEAGFRRWERDVNIRKREVITPSRMLRSSYYTHKV